MERTFAVDELALGSYLVADLTGEGDFNLNAFAEDGLGLELEDAAGPIRHADVMVGKLHAGGEEEERR